MAVKITHRVNGQQVRFANHEGAARYAEIMGGGVDKWEFANVPGRDPAGQRSSTTAGRANRRCPKS
jgi:ssDNA-binding replication factor A large subunit